jgi:hypothetical protein
MHGLLLDEVGGRVFFATSDFFNPTNTIGAVSLQGGAIEVFSDEEVASPYLALAGNRLYWTTWFPGSIRSVDLLAPGASAEDFALTGTAFGIESIGGEVYFADLNQGLFRFDPLDESPTLVISAAPLRHFLFDALNDGSYLLTTGSSVQRYSVASGVTTLATTTIAWDVVQDATNYYYSDETEGTLHRIAKPAGQPEQMVDGLAGARGLALDENYVYVVSGGAVTRVEKVPPYSSLFVASAQLGTDIAVDADFIYWTNTVTGTLMKVAKPL